MMSLRGTEYCHGLPQNTPGVFIGCNVIWKGSNIGPFLPIIAPENMGVLVGEGLVSQAIQEEVLGPGTN